MPARPKSTGTWGENTTIILYLGQHTPLSFNSIGKVPCKSSVQSGAL